jgi:hypothetical protein
MRYLTMTLLIGECRTPSGGSANKQHKLYHVHTERTSVFTFLETSKLVSDRARD